MVASTEYPTTGEQVLNGMLVQKRHHLLVEESIERRAGWNLGEYLIIVRGVVHLQNLSFKVDLVGQRTKEAGNGSHEGEVVSLSCQACNVAQHP
jgi:hypothetical protein